MKPHRPLYVLGSDSNNSDDEDKDVYAAKFVGLLRVNSLLVILSS